MQFFTRDQLTATDTLGLRKIARTNGIKEVGGRKVNSGRKADLIESILASQLGQKGSFDEDRKAKAKKATKPTKTQKTSTKAAIVDRNGTLSIPHPKAANFAETAKNAGWNVLPRIGSDEDVLIVGVRKGEVEITLTWRDGRYDYAASSYRNNGRKPVKVRNTSAALGLLNV